MIAGDVIRLFAIGAVGLLALADALTLPRLVGIAVVYGPGQAVFRPAFSSIVPTIVSDDLRVQANSLSQFVRPFTLSLVGPVVGGFRFVRRRTWLWVAMVAATVSLLFTWGPWDVLLPYVVKNELGGSAASLGIV